MTATRTPEQLDRFVEGVRMVNSSDSAYQHMLDLIARDVRRRFCHAEHVSVEDAAKYVEGWR